FLPIHPETLRRFVRQQHFGALAIADGAIDGLIGASRDQGEPGGCRVNLVMVRAGRRRQGIGRALVAEMSAQSRRTSLSAVAEPPLAEWLLHCGFKPCGGSVALER